MKIKLTSEISGTRDGKQWPAPGEEMTVTAEEGASLCESGLAEPVDSRNAKTETATKPDTATKRAAKKA